MSKKSSKRKSAKYFEGGDFAFGDGAPGGLDEFAERDEALRRAILAVPPGKVSSYGRIAEYAGYPRYHRLVARMLGSDAWDVLPWHRVLGADGKRKTTGRSAKEQRDRLRLEGVEVRANRVNMKKFQF
jgi:methylated-DNA-protein-cysteine methyltransferase related protein